MAETRAGPTESAYNFVCPATREMDDSQILAGTFTLMRVAPAVRCITLRCVLDHLIAHLSTVA